MAMIYFDKVTSYGVQVLQVGKSQMWDWCAWSKLGYQGTLNNSERIICFAETLRKGAYVVMELSYTFAWVSQRPHAVASFTSLRQALSAVMDYDFYDTNVSKHQTHWATGNRVMHAYEIWHIVDDGELWTAWEDEAHKNAQPDCVMLEIGECVSCASCWACGWNKQNVNYRPVRHRDDVFCTYCGDDDYGPWIPYYIPSIGYCYVCEDCEEQAKLDGGHYFKIGHDARSSTYNADIPF